MREIKFRVWDVQRKVLANVTSIMWLSEDEIEIDHDKNGLREPFQIHRNTAILEEFTGHYAGVFNALCEDEEHDEIYEGDKISVTYATQGMSNAHEHTITGVVKFKNGSFVVEWDFPKKGKYKYQTLNYVKRLGDWGVIIKIIGNIHDNPELQEAGE